MKRPILGLQRLSPILFSFAVVCLSHPAAAGDARRHDGLYLRLGGGLGYTIDSVKSDPYGVTAGGVAVTAQVDGTVSGFSGASELALGWSLSDGFVLGGGLYSAWIFSPKTSDARLNGAQYNGTVEFDASSFHVLGPFVDYYFDPGEGLHLQAGLGFAGLSAGDAHYRGNVLGFAYDIAQPSTGGSGFGLMFGFGDEWWVSDAFSLGVLARMTMGFMSGDNNGVSWNHKAFAPALLFVATMN